MKTRVLLLLLAALIAVSPLVAQTSFTLDKSHSAVRFTVTHLVISTVDGSFKDFDVNFSSGKPDFSDAKLEATIRVGSVSTESEKRDNHLRGPDFFDAEKYPVMTFKSSSFEKTGDNTYKIHGELTLRGVSRPVVLDAVYKGEVKAWGKTIVAFSASTEINRFDFGAKWDATLEAGALVVGERVKVNLTYEGVKQ